MIMKKVDFKVNHYKQKDNYRFVILSENGENERFPKTVQVSSFCLFDYSTCYIFDLRYENGKREFFIEDEKAQMVFEAEEMENAQEWKYRHEMILYKKYDNWHIFCYNSKDKLLGKEIIENQLYISEFEQNNKKRFHIFQINLPKNFELDCDEVMYAKDCNGHTVILAQEFCNVGWR